MNIKSNNVLALSLVSLLAVAPALQSMSYVNGAWNGIKVAPAKTWAVAKVAPGYAWNGIKAVSAKTLNDAKAVGRHVLDNKKTYATLATTGAVLAVLAYMYPDVANKYAQTGYNAVMKFPYAQKTKELKNGAASLWKRVRG